jgi:two-component system chemotaxis response regulator CheY
VKDKKLMVLTRDRKTGKVKTIVPLKPDAVALANIVAVPNPARVLVADDSPDDREMTIRHLGEAWPFERDMVVECADDGMEALQKLRRSRFALAVLDWNMPHLGGRELLRTIRKDGLRLPVVVVSGERHEDIAHDLRSMSAAFVPKLELNSVRFCSAIAVAMAESSQLHGVEWKV